MPCSLKKDGTPSTRSEHLVPCLSEKKPLFVGVNTGKEYATGAVSYLGRDVSTADILAKLDLSSSEAKRARPILDEYLTQLQQFKIGNVLSLSWVGIFKKLVEPWNRGRP
jgi:hypothetical protein